MQYGYTFPKHCTMQYRYIFPNTGTFFHCTINASPSPVSAMTDWEMTVLPLSFHQMLFFLFFLHCSFFFFSFAFVTLDNWLPHTRETSWRPFLSFLSFTDDAFFFHIVVFFRIHQTQQCFFFHIVVFFCISLLFRGRSA